jgi:RimJ/RimL family protein N-acetyltransferase
MEFERYGIRLRRMEETDLARVLRWRNAPHVRAEFEYQDEISPEQHAQWFDSLHPARDFYFIFSSAGKEAGVVHVKEFDEDSGIGEAGVFTGETAYLGTQVPVLAVLAMMDLMFEEMGVLRLRAKMRADNKAILHFNRMLGYEIPEGAEGQSFVYGEVSREGYFEAAARQEVESQ